MSYKRHELLSLREHIHDHGFTTGFGGICVAHLFSFLCCVFGGIRVAHLFSFLCCVFVGVRVAHLFSFLCCVFFVLFVFVLCLVNPMLPVSLDCPFVIAPSVFFNVYQYMVN